MEKASDLTKANTNNLAKW